MLEFTADKVQVYKDDDAETIVGFYDTGGGKLKYLELALRVRAVRGTVTFAIKAEIGRPKRVGTDCVTAAELTRDSFTVTFAADGSLAKVGSVRVAFAADAKAYRDLKRGLQEVFCDSDALRVAPVKPK